MTTYKTTFAGGDIADKITVESTDPQRAAGTGLNINAKTNSLFGDEATVGLYLATLETMHALMVQPGQPDEFSFGGRVTTVKKQRLFSRNLWKLLKRAKLISIPEDMYRRLHHKWDRAMCEELGYTWTPPNLNLRTPKSESDATRKHTLKRTNSTPFPTNLPFDVVYFAYGGSGVSLTRFQLAIKTNVKVAKRMAQVQLLGTLVCELGTCVDFFIGLDTQSADISIPTIFNSFHRGPDMIPGVDGTGTHRVDNWLGSDGNGTFDLLPFILNDLVDHVNSFVDLSVSSFPKKCKRDWRHKRKKLGTERREPPPHFYPYKLRSSVTNEGGDGPGRPREPLSYKTDVRGHTRLYIRRGPKPMKPSRWRYYAEQGFKVYIDDEPPRETRDKMRVKGHTQKRQDEWMAIKEKWIEPHLNSNDDTLPYRPKLTIA